MANTALVAVISGQAFGIGLAQENESGYWPQPQLGSYPTYEAAANEADRLNSKLGIAPEVAAMIVCSSMRQSNRRGK